MTSAPTCPKCAKPMTYGYAVWVPPREAHVRVHYCVECKETVAQTWIAGTYVGEGKMPLFAELRS